MPFHAVFLVLSLLGITDAGFLFYKRFEAKPLVCPINHDCNAVTQSRYSHTFGVPNDLMGLLYYITVFICGLILVVAPGELVNLPRFLWFITGGGFLFSAYLTYLQARVLRDYCFYCLISAGLCTLLFVTSFAL